MHIWQFAYIPRTMSTFRNLLCFVVLWYRSNCTHALQERVFVSKTFGHGHFSQVANDYTPFSFHFFNQISLVVNDLFDLFRLQTTSIPKPLYHWTKNTHSTMIKIFPHSHMWLSGTILVWCYQILSHVLGTRGLCLNQFDMRYVWSYVDGHIPKCVWCNHMLTIVHQECRAVDLFSQSACNLHLLI